MALKTTRAQRQQIVRPGTEFLWNLLTIITLLGMVAAVVGTLWVFQFPYSSINPFPPPTMPALIVLPSATATAYKLPATYTPEPTLTPEPSSTPVPATSTVSPTSAPSATMVGSGDILMQTVVNTPDTNADYPFALQADPSAIAAVLLYPDRGCQWLGVGGQVTDLQGRPVTGITVQLGGSLGTVDLDQTSLTGLATKYGQAGYEFELAKLPVASNNTLWVRLIDQARLPLSARVYFPTYSECELGNLIIVNFRQVR